MSVLRPAALYESVVKHIERKYTKAALTSAQGGFSLALSFEQPDLQTFKPTKYLRFFQVTGGSCTPVLPTALPVDAAQKIAAMAPVHGKFELRVVKDAEEAKHSVLELWQGEALVRRRRLGKMCGEVYQGGVWGGPSWSSDLSKLVMVVEAAEPKFGNYWEVAEGEEGGEKGPPDQKFAYKMDFGEKMMGKARPRLLVWDWQQDKLQLLAPKLPDNSYPAHPIFEPSGNGLIFSVYQLDSAFKPGLSACLNRRTSLYHLPEYTVEAAAVTCLTSDAYLSICPKMSPDGGQLLFLCHAEPFIAHSTCFELHRLSWPPSGPSSALVATVEERSEGDTFNGIYGFHDDVLVYEWLSPSQVAFQTILAGCLAVFTKSTDDTPPVRLLPPSAPTGSSISLLGSCGNALLLQQSHYLHPSKVYLLTDASQPPQQQQWLLVTDNSQLPPPSPQWHPTAAQHVQAVRAALGGSSSTLVSTPTGAEAVLLLPPPVAEGPAEGEEGAPAPQPLVVKLHGGPHSASVSSMTAELVMLLSSGVAVLLPNYRGSLGYGKHFANCLLGEIGIFDVQDCAALTTAALQQQQGRLDPSRVAVYGGSHGGFLSGWLVSHPTHQSLFRAGALWNPVTNIAAMVAATEIPEWCIAEVLARGPPVWPLSPAEVSVLYERSPMSCVANVCCPVLMLLGAADKRVPPLNGREFVAALRARGSPVTAYEYPEEGHAIAGAESNAHVVTTAVGWLLDQLAQAEPKEEA